MNLSKLACSLSALLLSLVIIVSCHKSDDSVPNVYVNEYVNLSFPSYLDLNAVNGWVYYPAGNRGIIIFRRSGTEYMAYERTCPFDANASCALIEVIPNNIIAIDSCCGSQFSLFDGSVTNGPATSQMKSYHADLLGNNTLHIYN